ncbi:hypothetical protein M0805_009567 [Coniferiporia weirii]|nr:hypothetical protein M0805_009567 [Coniferiporia weirii]
MRVYSPSPTVERMCVNIFSYLFPYTRLTCVLCSPRAIKDTVLPLKWPIKAVDGKTEITEILVPKDTSIIISILGANLSTKIWGDDGEEWKPERWLKPLPDSVSEARLPGVYSQMMTFIGGGRACIGFKFSEMEMNGSLSKIICIFFQHVLVRNGLIHPS